MPEKDKAHSSFRISPLYFVFSGVSLLSHHRAVGILRGTHRDSVLNDVFCLGLASAQVALQHGHGQVRTPYGGFEGALKSFQEFRNPHGLDLTSVLVSTNLNMIDSSANK